MSACIAIAVFFAARSHCRSRPDPVGIFTDESIAFRGGWCAHPEACRNRPCRLRCTGHRVFRFVVFRACERRRTGCSRRFGRADVQIGRNVRPRSSQVCNTRSPPPCGRPRGPYSSAFSGIASRHSMIGASCPRSSRYIPETKKAIPGDMAARRGRYASCNRRWNHAWHAACNIGRTGERST